MTIDRLSRRRALAGAAAVGLGGPVLAACGDSGDADAGADTAAEPTAPSADGGQSPSEPSEGGGGADAFAQTGDIPEGSGTIFADERVVITQPSAGEFRAFDASCTHQGCVVSSVTDTINCKCHGSSFALEDGSVVTGPATSPLAEAAITVDGDAITLS